MSAVPWESEESRNYICMDYIVTNVASKGLRKIFIQEWNSRYQASFGKWDDTNVGGNQLFHREKSRARPNKNTLQSKFQDGDTNEWDCTVLSDAILYSNSIGTSLNPTIRIAVDNIRTLRNEIKHIFEAKLDDKDFQSMTTRVENAFKALSLPIYEVQRIKIERNLYKSFQVLPPKPTHEVVHRSELIHDIKSDLEKLHQDNENKLTYFFISGNPGSGKSQLARQVCEDIYKTVNWATEAIFFMTLNGRELDSLLNSYEDFCRRLNCNESVLESVLNSSKAKDEKIKNLRSQISSRMRNWKKWWIIVDNVENPELIFPLLPQLGDELWNNGQIIVTTQNRNCLPDDSLSTKQISLSSGMSDQECRKLLTLLSRKDVNYTLLDDVAEKLDRQPLAMASAAVYMRQVIQSSPDFSWQEYLGKLEQDKRKMTEGRLKQINLVAYSSSMTTAVLLAVEKCTESNKILEHAFTLFSFISFEPLPLDLVVKYIQLQEESLDAEDIILAINLCSLFVHVENMERDVRLHRVVHEAVKIYFLSTKCEDDTISGTEIFTKKRTTENNLKVVMFKVLKTIYYFKNRKDKNKTIPHLKALHKEIYRLFPNQGLSFLSFEFHETEISEMYGFFGKTLHYFCEIKLSMEFYHQKLNIEIKRLGPNHIAVTDSYNNLGLVYHDKGDLEMASDYHERALKIKLEQLGPNHIDVAVSYNNLGIVNHDKGDLEMASDYHQRALKIRLEQLGPNHIDVAASYNNLGIVYYDKGDLELAGDYQKRALEIKLEQLGPNYIGVGRSYNNLGNVYHDKGDLEMASDYHQRALKISLEQLGPNHIDVAVSYNNLGNVYRNKSDLEIASYYHKRALKIRLEQLEPNHIDVAASYNNLGNVYRDKCDLEMASDYHKRALKIISEQLGPNHINVAASYNNLGNVYHDKGDLEMASDYHKRALKIRLEHLGPNHSDVAVSYNNLGNVYRDKGDLEMASDYHKRAVNLSSHAEHFSFTG
ncbi:uncharacterized protein LOC114530767 [Dendronephthya gigantea]|uniref:uncharacterized protein LOC114530767 n=1 Tax=Dendronephthya gigantea TaxID=151771 RepID=UPI001069B732|nr:uncharacterized protein LOC114530767 [Dendronephthya gigantea]XP_028408186.1 uncharacterized protein LOC114530767 [Dendronephthya gigantea]XP_028408187.1 uncharacterized protein LOC114530767 [Dendronephthya gigantea]XP_028408188.1 uncharacterized protein LOC114530767 [Dendronephthya gigantea]